MLIISYSWVFIVISVDNDTGTSIILDTDSWINVIYDTGIEICVILDISTGSGIFLDISIGISVLLVTSTGIVVIPCYTWCIWIYPGFYVNFDTIYIDLRDTAYVSQNIVTCNKDFNGTIALNGIIACNGPIAISWIIKVDAFWALFIGIVPKIIFKKLMISINEKLIVKTMYL